MISHQDKCLFIHIPKAAGQSVESVFVKRANLTWDQREKLLLRSNNDEKFGPPRLAHLFASEYVDKDHISEQLFNEYYKFSFVRNPWARLVSEFYYRKGHGDSLYQSDFRNFVLNAFPEQLQDDYQNGKDYYRHIIPQTSFLYDEEDKCLVDFIGRFENIQSDFDHVCKQLSIPLTELPHKNRTVSNNKIIRGFDRVKRKLSLDKKRDYRDYYDLETKRKVQQFYERDIDLLKYSF